jgi:hypothetical protein
MQAGLKFKKRGRKYKAEQTSLNVSKQNLNK